jgi:hypothetical protein
MADDCHLFMIKSAQSNMQFRVIQVVKLFIYVIKTLHRNQQWANFPYLPIPPHPYILPDSASRPAVPDDNYVMRFRETAAWRSQAGGQAGSSGYNWHAREMDWCCPNLGRVYIDTWTYLTYENAHFYQVWRMTIVGQLPEALFAPLLVKLNIGRRCYNS